MTNPLLKAIDLIGGQSALARRLNEATSKNISQSHVWLWLRAKKGVPAEYCLAIEEITHGRVLASDLRPDVFGNKGGAAS